MLSDFYKQAKQFDKALEARGPPFLHSSKAEISVSQLDDPLTKEVFSRFADLLPCLAGEEALSLAEARSLYNNRILDTLCSMLSRVSWRQFCDQLDVTDSSTIFLGCGLDCVLKQISAWTRVDGQQDAAVAMVETFGRYFCVALL